MRQGLIDSDVVEEAVGADSPLRRIPRTYGKVQDKHPARWLTHDEAIQLVAACQDGTDLGLRDEIVIRLGLLGLRASEIGHLTFGAIHDDGHITWMGKGHKARSHSAPVGLRQALTRWVSRYEKGLRRPVRPNDPIVCRQHRGGPTLMWGVLSEQPRMVVARTLTHRASNAKLGHVTAHDLRRTAAGLLHRSLDKNGAHHFDLLDIQKVLGHSDPATTMRCYLDPLDTAVIDKAARVLDI